MSSMVNNTNNNTSLMSTGSKTISIKPSTTKNSTMITKPNVKTTSVSMVGGGIPKPQTVAKNYVSATPKSKISISATLKNKTINSKSPMRQGT